MNTYKRKQIAEDILGTIEWENDLRGHCRCPGIHRHTTKNRKQDCRVYLDGGGWIDCFHDSCHAEVEQARSRLRAEIRKADGEFTTASKSGLPRTSIDSHTASLIQKAHNLRNHLQNDYCWSYKEIKSATPAPIHPIEQRANLFLLFPACDRVWNGHLYESGKPHHAARFKPTEEWLASCADDMRGVYRPNEHIPLFREFIVPTAFKPGTYSRSKDNVLSPRFLVVESDIITKDEVGAVFRWLSESIKLRAVIDTGGKSLHGWFDYPSQEILRELRVILPILGCDRKMFNPAQPCRMPGVLRSDTGNMQSMIYLEGGAL